MTLLAIDPGFLPTMRQLALAVADELDAYYTPYWPGRKSRPLLRVPVLGRELARRTLPPELERVARSHLAATELARVGLTRARISRHSYALLWRRNEGLDRAVAPTIPEGATVLGENGGCRASFERVRARGGIAVLDHPIARFAFGHELLREEAELVPDFADTIETQLLAPEHLERIEREAALADLVVVGSRFAAESFRGHAAEASVRAISYGVDTRAFSPARAERRPGPLRVLFAGHVSQRKGISYLLDALRLLDPARFELTVAGNVYGSAQGLAAHRGRFRHRTGIRPQDMPAVYREADVLVLPSLLEGSAVVVLEAMASGLPVIVTPNTGADAVEDGVEGFVVPIRSAEAIAARLELLAADEDRRREMGVAARAAAARQTWARFRAEFRSALAELRAPVREAVGV